MAGCIAENNIKNGKEKKGGNGGKRGMGGKCTRMMVTVHLYIL